MAEFRFDRSLCRLRALLVVCATVGFVPASAVAQSVGLPAPRLLTVTPMGGQAGTTVEVTIGGDHLEEVGELTFSHPGITATPKLDEAGQPVPNRYVVTIAEDCPAGIHDARVTSRLGISSARAFSVGHLPEVQRTEPNTSLETALELQVNSVCNATMTDKAIDHYVFSGRQGQRVIIDCAARGIDSKADPVLILADAQGGDLLAERRGGAIDFTVPEEGRYVVKVHELTYRGGSPFYYRLALWELPAEAPVERLPATQPVNAFSWPPVGLPDQAPLQEAEPNDRAGEAQKITLPCDIAGSFYPAADVDVFEFEAREGEIWWIEVASERLGRPTDPAVLVQQVTKSEAGEEVLTDVAEFTEIPSPVKVSSNHYAYDGPVYNAGTSDVLGKLEIKQDGLYRLQLTDRFGGTRNDPHNVYRLVIRQGEPDFALVAWGLHMGLRNGDRNALSKPIALRNGATMALEVVALRRDGFDGDIELVMEDLPEGVTAQGVTIPSGQSRGIMLLSADQEAPPAAVRAKFVGRGTIDGEPVERPCRLASVAWPIPDHWQEIPKPRLVADVPVSVSGHEFAPMTVAPPEGVVIEARQGEKLTIPLIHTRRSEFSGESMQAQVFSCRFGNVPAAPLSLNADESEVVLDLGAAKTPPGEYQIAFYGGAVVKYRHRPDLVTAAEQTHQEAQNKLQELDAEANRLAELAQTATEEEKAEAQQALENIMEQKKQATAAVEAAAEQLKKATEAARPKDIADILVSRPITVRVHPKETEQ